MVVQCSWCGKFKTFKFPLTDKSTTHGMCKECSKDWLSGSGLFNVSSLGRNETMEDINNG